MSIQEFRDYMASGKPVIGGSDVHMMFHKLSQQALRITAEINGKYHTPDELHTLLEQLFGALGARFYFLLIHNLNANVNLNF